MIGYTKPLFILAFDHRNSFVTSLFNKDVHTLTGKEKEQAKEAKYMVYQGFEKAVTNGIPKEYAALLTDEEFGWQVLEDAKEKKYNILLPVEKSGQKNFALEYGDDFGKHIEHFHPAFVKALIRYNPHDNKEENHKQLLVLKKVSEYCKVNKYNFLLEVLIPATEQQLLHVGGDRKRFDAEVRPEVSVQMIVQMQQAGIDVSVWKLEGFERARDYTDVVAQARSNGRNEVGIVVLGRGAKKEQVAHWVKEGAQVPGVIGFAIGRTIFSESLTQFRNGTIQKDEAMNHIANNFRYFYDMFMDNKIK